MSSRLRIAFLGLGLMGRGMAARLLREKFSVAVYNRSRQRAEQVKSLGAKVSDTAREAAAHAEVVIAMVADDDASRNVWLGADGALAGAAPGTVLIESSTISPGWVHELAAAASAKGCELLDAPVTGSMPQAAAGQLCFLVGGADAVLERVRPVLAVLGRDIIHLGPVGSGALVKLINNFVCGVQAVAIAEALALIERTTLDPAKALAVLTEGAPGSPLVKLLSKGMTARDFSPNFPLKLMAKDLKYAIDEAKDRSLPLATAAAALQTMRDSIKAGLGDQDFSAVVESLRGRIDRCETS